MIPIWELTYFSPTRDQNGPLICYTCGYHIANPYSHKFMANPFESPMGPINHCLQGPGCQSPRCVSGMIGERRSGRSEVERGMCERTWRESSREQRSAGEETVGRGCGPPRRWPYVPRQCGEM